MLDLKIVNGWVVDGTGTPRYQADVGIRGDQIVAIGDLKDEEAAKTLDASGKMVAPGFIDFHTHSDLSILYDRYTRSRIHTGVTTDVVGNCGIGVAPVKDENKDLLLDYLSTRIVGTIPAKLELHWHSYEEYLDYVDEHNPAVNVVPLAAQGALRIHEMGFSEEPATPEQLEHMKEEARKAMEAGAFALTSGLIYLPGAYTGTDELAELCTAIAPYGGYYCTHMRGEGDSIWEALDEAIEIAKKGGVPLHISHLKIMGAKYAGQIDKVFERIEQARKEGLDVTFDCYPYNAGMTSLSSFLPPWAFEGGVAKMVERIQVPELKAKMIQDMKTGLPNWQDTYLMLKSWDHVVIASMMKEENKPLEGKSLAQIAKERNQDPFDTLFDLLISEHGKIQMVMSIMDDNDVDKVVCRPEVTYGSDSMNLSTEGLLSIGKPHPRAFGTFGRIFSHYVRETGMMTFEDAVRKMTSVPAKRLGLGKRGVLKEGNYADVVVFDPETIADKATYTDPKQYTVGIEHVVVNGKVALENGEQTDVLAGRVLRRGRDN